MGAHVNVTGGTEEWVPSLIRGLSACTFSGEGVFPNVQKLNRSHILLSGFLSCPEQLSHTIILRNDYLI